MSTHTALTVSTRFVEVDNIRLAYRRWGKPGGFPLVFMQYFSGNLDDWDPLVTDGFAADYDVILFNNAGIASSGAKRRARTLDYPKRVRRIISMGTGPGGGERMTFTELSAEERADPDQFLLTAFFSPSDASEAAGRAYLKRLAARTRDRDLAVSKKTAEAQLRAIREWGTVPSSNRYATLQNITHPILIVHGNKDIVVLPINAFILAEQLPNAQLITYPLGSCSCIVAVRHSIGFTIKQLLFGYR